MSLEWKKITAKFTNKCIECGNYINQGDIALWMQNLGIKHIECPTGIIEDDSRLVIIDKEDQERLGKIK